MLRTWLFAGLGLFLGGLVVLHTQLDPTPFPFTNIDEHAHYSYTLELIRTQSWWPDFGHFPMYDVPTGQPSGDANYINHPPTFYWLMKLVQQAFPEADPLRYRLVPLAFYLVFIGIYAGIGNRLKLDIFPSVIYAALPILFYLPLQSGYYNNDSMALAGGGLACLGSFQLYAGARKQAFYWLAGGLVLASVKLTSFLLVGLYVLLALMPQWRAISRRSLLGLAALMGVLAIPYLAFTLRDGGPAPHTFGQVDWVIYYAKLRGWYDAPRMGFLQWLLKSLNDFANQFSSREATFLPLLMLIGAFATLLLPVRAGEPAWFRPLGRAAAIATLLVLIAHLGFSWPRYVEYGWIYDMFVRYYFPLLPAYGATMAGAYLRLSPPAKPVKSPHATRR